MGHERVTVRKLKVVAHGQGPEPPRRQGRGARRQGGLRPGQEGPFVPRGQVNGKEGTMAKLDIIDRSGKTAAQVELPESVFSQAGERPPDLRGRRQLPGQPAPGQRGDQDPGLRQRRRQEALAAEGHRPGPRRQHALTSLEEGRDGLRTAPPRLFLRAAEEGPAERPPLGPGREARRPGAHRRQRARGQGTQDQGGRRPAQGLQARFGPPRRPARERQPVPGGPEPAPGQGGRRGRPQHLRRPRPQVGSSSAGGRSRPSWRN